MFAYFDFLNYHKSIFPFETERVLLQIAIVYFAQTPITPDLILLFIQALVHTDGQLVYTSPISLLIQALFAHPNIEVYL